MKKIILFSLFLFIASCIFAQTNSAGVASWNPIGLDVAGHNTIKGIEAFYQLNNCKGENVVFVQLINHNNYAVTVEWYPAVFTKELKWIKKENPSDKISVTLNANAELAGDCSGAYQATALHLKDFSVNAADFNRYGVSNFVIYPK
ncbi:MAG: hypothetical protein HY841_12725 [Bacteroidetes bacterium]|nr:hypothetical protein [Bacteroidota bacterium]